MIIVLMYKKGENMKPQDKLKAWMGENNYTYTTLAHELGFSDTYIFKLTAGTKPLGSGFKYRFILRFGLQEASRIFEVARELQLTP